MDTPLNFEDNIKFENTKAHLLSLKMNLNDTKNQLNDSVVQLKEVSNLIVEARKELSAIQNKSNEIVSYYNQRKDELFRYEDSLIARENSLAQKEEEINKEIARKKVFILTLEKEITDLLYSINGIYEKYESKIKQNKEELKSTIDKVTHYENIINQKLEDIKKLEDERVRLSNQREIEERALRDFKESSEAERRRISDELEQEKKKVSVPMAILNHKEEEMKKKSKAFTILQSRLKRQYFAANPTSPLPIELID